MAALAAAFAAGFGTAARALCWVAGAASAVLLALLVVLAANVALQYIFDNGTDMLAAAWRRKGKAPRWRWAQAILKGTQEGGGANGREDQKATDEVP